MQHRSQAIQNAAVVVCNLPLSCGSAYIDQAGRCGNLTMITGTRNIHSWQRLVTYCTALGGVRLHTPHTALLRTPRIEVGPVQNKNVSSITLPSVSLH